MKIQKKEATTIEDDIYDRTNYVTKEKYNASRHKI